MKHFLSLLLFIAFSMAPARAQGQNASDIQSQIGHIVTCSFRMAADSKFIIDSLYKPVKAANNDQLTAFYEAYKAQWEAYYSTLTDEKKQMALMNFEQLAKASPYKALRAHVLFWTGMNSLFHGKVVETKALTQVLKAKTLLEEVNYERLPYAIEYYKALADVYSYFGDYNACIYYTEKATTQPPNPYLGRQTLYNNLGTYYTRLNDYRKAKEAFEAGVIEARKLGQPDFALMVQANIGNLLRLQGRYEEALPSLYHHAILNERKIPEDAALTRLYIANCLLHLDSVEKAKGFLVRPDFSIPYWTQPAYDLNWYETRALFYRKEGNLGLALTYKDSLMDLKDSIREARDNKKITVLESSLQAERFAAERKALESDRYWRNIIIILLTAASLMIVLLMLQRRREEKRHEAQKRLRAEEMLAHANERLNQYLQSIKEKNALIEQIRRQLDEANAAGIRLPEWEKTQYLENLQNSVLFTEPDWERFKGLFEQVFPGFFARLLQHYPKLSPAEIRLRALEELNLNDKEKGAMLNISAESVKKARYRLRKKYPRLLTGASQEGFQ